MKKTNSCPLDGSWMRDYCTTYESQKNEGTLSECQHQNHCNKTRADIESNVNESVAMSKKVLIGRIPDIFKK